jgi:alkylation response protein AidB-like acyl-CoA dehydrogenase
MAGPTLIEHGTDDQRRRHLPRILSGEEIWCQLFSEPGAGSDLASLSTRAVRHGEAWVVDGQKVWTTIAQVAHYGMLLVRTDPDVPKHEGLTYLICDLHAAGVEVRPLRQMTGAAEFNEVFLSEVNEVFLSEVVVPDTQRVGGVGDGWRVARTTLMNERVALAGVTLDPAALFGGRPRDPWRSYLERVPTPDDPVVRDRLARVYLEARLKEVTAARAEAARSAGRRPGPEGGVGKVANAEHARRRGEVAVDAAGARGIARLPGDDGAEGREQAFLRSRAATIEGGTSEVLRNQIGEAVLGLPREPEVDKGVPWRQIRRSSP